MEDFYCLANGLVLRRQAYESLMPGRHEGYAREPIEIIGMCPVGKLWKDVLATNEQTGERHARRCSIRSRTGGTTFTGVRAKGRCGKRAPRRAGCKWQEIDDSAGVVLVVPMRAGAPFCTFGTASGFDAKRTRIKEHSFPDTGGLGWVSSSWDHWPVGWLNSQGHVVDAHRSRNIQITSRQPEWIFSPCRTKRWPVAKYWSLIGVGSDNLEEISALRGDGWRWEVKECETRSASKNCKYLNRSFGRLVLVAGHNVLALHTAAST